MDLRRLRVGEWVTALAGVALLVSLFLPWYRSCVPGGGCDQDLSGWQALAVNDVIFAVIALAAIGLVAVTAMQPTAAVPIAYDALLFLVSMVGGVLAIVRVLSLPELADERAFGLWIGLAGAIGITFGAALSMRDERLSEPGRLTDPTGRPISAPPAVETVQAPPAEGSGA
ncbi:MAG: hypothetical protein WKF40_04610 [Thermoleophilaceae bacterium]